jgi:ApeA N-terminal domain 1
MLERAAMGPLSLQGFWWLPKTPDEQKTGTLTFDQSEGGRLKIVGSLTSMGIDQSDVGCERDAIFGFTTTGKPITLLKPFLASGRLGIPGIATETWHIDIIAIGAHFKSCDDALFARGWVRFDGIARWLEHRPFFHALASDATADMLNVRRPERIDFGSISDATIYSGSRLMKARESDERWTSTSEVMIAIESNEPQTLDWYFVAAGKLRALAELLYGRSLQHTMLKVEIPREPNSRIYPANTSVEIYAQIIGGDDNLPSVDSYPMLTLPTLLEAAPNALADWFAQYETLSAALHLLSAVASNQRMFINVRFLLAAQAVETFHRESSPGTIVPDQEYAAILEVLKAAVPSETIKPMRDKLNSTLKYANEPSLRQRLRALIALARDGRDDVMPAYDQKWVNAVVDTRNHETHHGVCPDNLLTGADLHWTIRRIVVLLIVLFLRRLGLPSDAIDEAIGRHREFRILWTTSGIP